MARRRDRSRSDPLAALGLPASATADDIRRARNRLAKEHHPDVGGSAERMRQLNEAADEALARIARPPPATAPTTSPTAPTAPTRHGSGPRRRSEPPPRRRVGRDHPSFTIEALPAEAFEALVIVANVLGDVADDDPPYRLDVVLEQPHLAWCRVDLVPDGGGSTVSLTVASPDTGEALGVLEVRDRFITELNALDWTDDGPRRRTLPS